MSDLDRALDRELDGLEADLANGIISLVEYGIAVRRLEREAREYAMEEGNDERP
jgi:hypothetical protein